MPFGALRFVEGGEALVIVGTGGEVVSWKPGSGRGIVRERELPFRDTWPELTEGARLVCGMKDGVARIFDRASGEVIATVEGVPGAEGVVLSPDGEVLTVRRSDRSFALLEVPSLRETAVVTLEEEILGSPWFSPDRKSLLLWTRTGFLLFDRSTRDEVYMRQPGDSRPRLCAGSADGRTLLVGVDAMDPASQYFQAVAVFHRQGDSWREEARISGGFIGFSGLDTTSSGNLAVAGDRQRILVYDLEAKDPGRGEVFHGHRGAVRGVVFSPDARTIASVGSAPDVARIWESHSNRWFNPYRSDESRAYLTMAFSPDGRYLAAAGCMGRNLAGVVDVLDARTRERRFRVEGPVLPVAGVRFSPEGRWLVAGSQASDIHVWDLSSGEPVLVHRFETESRVNSVSATATLVVAGEESGISVWDLVRGEEVARYQDHAGRVPWIEFDPPGRTFLTVSSDGKVLRRALEGGVSRIGFHGQTVRVARFSPDGSRIVSGCDDGAIRIWNANGGAAPVQLVEHRDRVFALAFHPGGRLLASGDASGVVHLWDATRGLHLAELQGHQGMVMALEFSPDGGELWSSSHAGMLGCWDLDYYEKHLRGNVMRHLERLRVRYELDPEGVERWMQWVREEEVTAGSR
jgi:WD40 repeat protein